MLSSCHNDWVIISSYKVEDQQDDSKLWTMSVIWTTLKHGKEWVQSKEKKQNKIYLWCLHYVPDMLAGAFLCFNSLHDCVKCVLLLFAFNRD